MYSLSLLLLAGVASLCRILAASSPPEGLHHLLEETKRYFSDTSPSTSSLTHKESWNNVAGQLSQIHHVGSRNPAQPLTREKAVSPVHQDLLLHSDVLQALDQQVPVEGREAILSDLRMELYKRLDIRPNSRSERVQRVFPYQGHLTLEEFDAFVVAPLQDPEKTHWILKFDGKHYLFAIPASGTDFEIVNRFKPDKGRYFAVFQQLGAQSSETFQFLGMMKSQTQMNYRNGKELVFDYTFPRITGYMVVSPSSFLVRVW